MPAHTRKGLKNAGLVSHRNEARSKGSDAGRVSHRSEARSKGSNAGLVSHRNEARRAGGSNPQGSSPCVSLRGLGVRDEVRRCEKV